MVAMRTAVVKHQIETGHTPPIKQAQGRVPLHQQGVVRQHLEDLLQKEVVHSSTSRWASPVVVHKTKDGGTRFCVDNRKFSGVSRKDDCPLPRVDEIVDETLDVMEGAKMFTTSDLASRYGQVTFQ